MKARLIKEQRLDDLENDFGRLLVSCLEECGNGRWGLFGQNERQEPGKYYQWDEGHRLKETALQIRSLRAEFGLPNPLAERFLYFCSLRGANIPGEPKLAKEFLEEIHRGDFVSS